MSTQPANREPEPDLASYKHLYAINAGFEQIIASLGALKSHPAFDRKQLKVLSDLAREARASSSAYLTEVLQTIELAEAGRRFRQRIRRERRDERGG